MQDMIRKLFATRTEIAQKAASLIEKGDRRRALMLARDIQRVTPNPISRFYWQRVENTLSR